MGLRDDSGTKFLEELGGIAAEDVAGLKEAQKSYGESWKIRGGIGAFMMLARKWDRLEIRVKKLSWDIFEAIIGDERAEGVIDDVVDLRRYLMLVEAEMRARGFKSKHRDNAVVEVLELNVPPKDDERRISGSGDEEVDISSVATKGVRKNCCSNCSRYTQYGRKGIHPRCAKVPSRIVPIYNCPDFLENYEITQRRG